VPESLYLLLSQSIFKEKKETMMQKENVGNGQDGEKERVTL
jgi:hypothetical protein